MQRHILGYASGETGSILKIQKEAALFLGGSSDFDQSFEQVNAGCLQSLSCLFEMAAKKYEKKKGFGASLDFDDLLIKAAHLAESSPEARKALQRRFRYLLVDEFQDTDPLQWRLFQLLSKDQKPGFLFLVGDPKQSIYGFRRADVRLFFQAKNYISQKKHTRGAFISMKENYRSVPSIIDFVNYFFMDMMPETVDDKESFDVTYESLIAQRKEPFEGVEILYSDLEALPEENPFSGLPRHEWEAECIAQRIKQLIGSHKEGNFQPRDVAILLRSRTHLKSYEESLFRHNIPFVTRGGIGFYERQEIFDLANLLQFIISPQNDPSFFGLLRSPFLGFENDLIFRIAQIKGGSLWFRFQKSLESEDFSPGEKAKIRKTLELFHPFLYEAQRIPLPILIKEFLTKTGGWASLVSGAEGKRQLENVEKLLQRARLYENSGFLSLVDFTEDLVSLIEDIPREGEAILPETDVNAVEIMTIHKAKGLEFPVVVLPGMNSPFKPVTSSFIMDDKYGLAIKALDPSSRFESRETALFSALKQREKKKNLSEEIRLFYVAATRAREKLVLSCTKPRKKDRESRFSWLEKVFHLTHNVQSSKAVKYKIRERMREIPILHMNSKEWDDHSEQLIITDTESKTDMSLDFRTRVSLLNPIYQKQHRFSLSVTSLNHFRLCPVKYYFTHVLGWNQESLNSLGLVSSLKGTRKSVENPEALLKGTIIHGMLQTLFSEESFDEKNLVYSLVKTQYIHSLNTTQNLAKDIRTAWDHIKKTGEIKRLLKTEAKHSELAFQLCIEPAMLQGRVDLCYFDSGTWHVLDFKTGWSSGANQKRIWNAYETQLESYALFLSAFSPNQDKYPVLVYLVEHDKIYPWSIPASRIEPIRDKIIELIARERGLREEYSGKHAGYGKKIIEKLLNTECAACQCQTPEKCNLHINLLNKIR